jgi:WD40-like Beta Propeller Repeat
MAALAFVLSIGQTPNESVVVVTVPLHQPDVRSIQAPYVSVSADGRFIAFLSAVRLVPEDTNERDDVYVLDRESGGVTVETADAAVASGHRPAISGTGRFVVYETATQLLVIRDRSTGSVHPLQRGGEAPNGSSRGASISADGRYVAFTSGATNLLDGRDPAATPEAVYVADTASMTFRRVAVSGFTPALSADARFVAFSSPLPPVAADAPKIRTTNTYIHDLQTGVTTQVSVGATGGPANGSSYNPAISGDGRYVAFVSDASNLVRRHDYNRVADVYLRDTLARVTELISRTPSGAAGNAPSRHPALSGDGRIVIFQSEASDLICGTRCPATERDINLVSDVFRRDRLTGVTELISRGRAPWMEPSLGAAADGTGRIVAFASRHPLDQADDRHDYDLFVWARELRR